MTARCLKWICLYVVLFAEILTGREIDERILEGYRDAGLSERVINTLRARSEYSGENRIEEIEGIFSGFSDDEILKDLSDALFIFDEIDSDSGFKMRASTPSAFMDILRGNKDLVLDDSYLRLSLRSETDPRRFYLLRQFSIGLRVSQGRSYIDESRHMLHESGVVAVSYLRAMRRAYHGDVSRYAYHCIVQDLRELGSAFTRPDEALPHEEKVAMLERWLDANWSSKAEVSGSLKKDSKRIQLDRNSKDGSSKQLEGGSRLLISGPIWVALILLLFAIWVWVKGFR